MIQNLSIQNSFCNLHSNGEKCFKTIRLHRCLSFRTPAFLRATEKKEILGINWNQMLLERKETNPPGSIMSFPQSVIRILDYITPRIHAESTLRKSIHLSFCNILRSYHLE